jgi:hypothetical protein
LGKSGGEKTGGRERGSEVFVHGVPLHGPKIKTRKPPGSGFQEVRILQVNHARRFKLGFAW